MADLPKPRFEPYEYANAETRLAMNPVIGALERERWSSEAVTTFGAEATQNFQRSVSAIQAFLEDPTSPEADQAIRDGLRDDYLASAKDFALMLGAGEEVLRRYDAEYLEQAAEELMITEAEAERKQIDTLIACRDALLKRLDEIKQPEKTHDFVCDAIRNLEGRHQLSVSIAQGLPLTEPISVRKAPLKLMRPGMTP